MTTTDINEQSGDQYGESDRAMAAKDRNAPAGCNRCGRRSWFLFRAGEPGGAICGFCCNEANERKSEG